MKYTQDSLPKFSQDSLPSEFYNYLGNFGQILSCDLKFSYDSNGDSLPDYSKIYLSKRDSFGVSLSDYPKYHVFYLKEDGENKIRLIFRDNLEDGINDNEEVIFYIPKKRKVIGQDL